MSAIDISFWQGNPDFVQARNAGVSLVIMKCGSGEGARFSQDSVYAMNRAAARAAGLSVGSYFFNGPVDPIAAAEFQFSLIDWRPGDIVAIDVENSGGQPHWNPAQVLAWCQQILSHGIPADRILVYMSSSVLTAGWDAVAALGVGLWVAQYGPNDGNPHSAPNPSPWASWALWQYTSVGSVPGFAGRVDVNQISLSWASTGVSIIADKYLGDETMKVISGGTIALVGEYETTVYTQDTGAQGFSIGANSTAFGQAPALTPDQVATLINEAKARRAQLVADVAAAVAAKVPAAAPVTGGAVNIQPVLDALAAFKALEVSNQGQLVAAIQQLPADVRAKIIAAP